MKAPTILSALALLVALGSAVFNEVRMNRKIAAALARHPATVIAASANDTGAATPAASASAPELLAVRDRFDNRVDLLAGLRGLDPQAFERTITVPFQGTSLRVIGREDFIAMKCYAGGPLDIADARQALKTADERLNVDLLRRATRRFGRAAADALELLLSER